MNHLTIVAALLCFGIASSASAADAEKKKKKEEAKKGPDIAAVFAKLDANQDKKVDAKEFEAFTGLTEAKKKKKAVADVADADKKKKKADKNAPAADLAKKRAEWFKKLDANKDGGLTLEEFMKIKEVVEADMAEKKAA